MTSVTGHYRRTRKCRRVWIKPHMRNKRGIKKISVTVSNSSIRVSSAEYHPDTRSSSIAIVDEDKDKTIFVMKEVPLKIEKLHVDDHGDIGVGIKAKTKKREDVTAVIVTPKDV